MSRAEAVTVSSDERGFELNILVDEDPTVNARGWLTVNVQSVAVELLQEIQRTIGEWYAEGESVREEYMRAKVFACGPEDVDESAGLAYDLHDPKGPAYHSTHTDIWDNRDKTRGER